MNHELFVSMLTDIIGDGVTQEQITRLENLTSQYEKDLKHKICQTGSMKFSEFVSDAFHKAVTL